MWPITAFSKGRALLRTRFLRTWQNFVEPTNRHFIRIRARMRSKKAAEKFFSEFKNI